LIFENINKNFKGRAKIENYVLYDGIELAFADIAGENFEFHHHSLPDVVEINYCKSGRIGWNLKNNAEIYLGSGDFSVNTMDMCAKKTMNLPLGYYRGIIISIDIKKITTIDVFKGSDIRGELLCEKFCGDENFATITGNDKTEMIFSHFYAENKNLKIPYFKLKVPELILYMLTEDCLPDKPLIPYLPTQIETIKIIHSQLVKNLDQRFTIEELSKQHHINPTTLKSVFKTVYGTSVAAHIKKHRIEKAAKLLTTTDDSISVIAKTVGYESQSKFTTAFKEMYGLLPKEYRKEKK
jgi:AraC-like DNA-binding protein